MQAEVWNDHSLPYKETFKEEEITIPAKGKIVMDYFDACQFIGQYRPFKKTGTGDVRPQDMKMLRMVPLGGETAPAVIRCQMCMGKFDSQTELLQHSEKYHKESMIPEKPKK